jgi:hypothetical protein
MQITANTPTQQGWNKFTSFSGKVFINLITWAWTKTLLYWIVMSAGTASELFFLLAAIWVSVNANVHPFVLTYMSEKQAIYFTYLATTGFVALPECIVGLAMVTTIGHIKMWKVGRASSVLWSVLFGIPTIIFLVLSLVTIGCSVANVTFTMPTFAVVIRALAAFSFAFTAFIYHFLGKPQEQDRLAEKDSLLATLRADMVAALAALASEKDGLLATLRAEKDKIIAALTSEIASIRSLAAQEKETLLAKIDVQNDEIESLKSLLSETQRGFTELHRAVNMSDDAALEAYGSDLLTWVKSGVKSANVGTITHYTGLSTAKINNALKRGDLRKAPNSREDNPLILISSLVSWLKNLPLPERKTDEMAALHLVNSDVS